jgi:hypothetical protein
MKRSIRSALLMGSLLILAAGTVLATQTPRPTQQGPAAASQEEQPDAPLSADELARVVDKLAEQGIDADADQLGELAATYGLGGAVRLLAWADATGMSLAELRELRDGAGWGTLGHDLDVGPGIGWIMGNGGGHGRENAPGQQQANPGGGASD